jgi:hypothetical protein
MFFRCYLQKGKVYLPTCGMVSQILFRDVEPVAVVPVLDTGSLRRALHESVERENPIVPHLSWDQHGRPIVLKYAEAKSWAAFERSAVTWSISLENGIYNIQGYRRARDRGWEEDPNQVVTFPPDSSIDAVIDRMIEILQAAAAK